MSQSKEGAKLPMGDESVHLAEEELRVEKEVATSDPDGYVNLYCKHLHNGSPYGVKFKD